MNPFNNLRMEMKEALTNMWNRLINGKLSELDARVTALEQRVAALDGQSASSSATNNETEG
jgi:O-acetylhomoserine/O-acetylserine sulfhydrylase-like pyridoxal-dependent enzyme